MSTPPPSPPPAYSSVIETRAQHDVTTPANRRVKIVLKDASDGSGRGMTFEVKYLDTVKNAFDQFKAASCKKCRAIDEMRFKTADKRIY